MLFRSFWLVGREDDLITTFGYRVSPFEVERVLNEHPKITESAVAGIALEDEKIITTAFVVLNDKYDTEEVKAELLEYCNNRLAKYKCPREVIFRDSIPKTPNGKIRRRVLRETYSNF